jgi:hypothetical protein
MAAATDSVATMTCELFCAERRRAGVCGGFERGASGFFSSIE